MRIKEYLIPNWKKPELDEGSKKAIERGDELEKNLDACYSRLETIEICTSNSKDEDAILLTKFLTVNMANLLLVFFYQSKISLPEEVRTSLEKIPDSDLVEVMKEFLEKLNLDTSNNDSVEEKISITQDTINKIEKIIRQKYKEEIYNKIKVYKTRLLLQSIILSGILLVGLYSGYKKYNELKPLKPDTFTILHSENKNLQPFPDTKLNVELKPSEEWQPIVTNFAKPTKIGFLKIEPIHQKDSRFQIKEIKFYAGDKVVKNIELILTQETMMSLPKLIQLNDGVTLGRANIGQASEFVTKAINPEINFLLDDLDGITKIEFTVRYIKKHKKFKN
ncbi:MAG: hypothetical protein SFU98_08500 [Leptospiraceae bacterium]|nr:hypothetical protein [Leptospiraceae bacterium]